MKVRNTAVKILHILRNPNDRYPVEIATIQQDNGDEVAILLIQDAVLSAPGGDLPLYVGQTDAEARGVRSRGGAALLSYDEMVTLIFEYDSVILW